MTTPRSLAMTFSFCFASVAASQTNQLLLLESFDHRSGQTLAGRDSFGFGMTGAWTAGTNTVGFSINILDGSKKQGETWNGKLTNLPQSGHFAGANGRADHTWGDRKLDTNVTVWFQDKFTIWMSWATVHNANYRPDQRHFKPMIAIGAGKLDKDRGKFATGQAIGMGAVFNLNQPRASYWNDADNNGAHERFDATTALPFSSPQIMVAKIEWGAVSDKITIANFDDTKPLTMALWNTATKSTVTTAVNLDQAKFDTLSLHGSRYYVDEIRIGLSFDSVVKGMTVIGKSLQANAMTASLAGRDSQKFTLNAGKSNANKTYLLVGSLSGTSPGIRLGNVTLPLNVDAYLDFTAALPNSPLLTNSSGKLDANGMATASFNAIPAIPATAVGTKFDHAYLVLGTSPFDFASNAVPLTLNK